MHMHALACVLVLSQGRSICTNLYRYLSLHTGIWIDVIHGLKLHRLPLWHVINQNLQKILACHS